MLSGCFKKKKKKCDHIKEKIRSRRDNTKGGNSCRVKVTNQIDCRCYCTSDGESELKPPNSDPEPSKPLPTITVVMKVNLHAKGSAERILNLLAAAYANGEILEFSLDRETELVHVTGPIDGKSFTDTVTKKLKTAVEIVQINPRGER